MLPRFSKTVKRAALLGITVCMLFACNEEPAVEQKQSVENKRVFDGYHHALDTVIKEAKGIIAGVELGDSRASIRREQVENAADQDKEGLVYEQVIDSLTRYSITYTFENDTITEIEVLISCSDHDEGEKILNDLKNYYRIKYTAPVMDKGYYVFNCFDSRKRNFKITLTDNGGSSNSLIDMLIYREK